MYMSMQILMLLVMLMSIGMTLDMKMLMQLVMRMTIGMRRRMTMPMRMQMTMRKKTSGMKKPILQVWILQVGNTIRIQVSQLLLIQAPKV